MREDAHRQDALMARGHRRQDAPCTALQTGAGTTALLAGLLLGSAGLAHAAPVDQPRVDVVERTDYYRVKGNTAHELAAEVRRQGPRSPSGRRAWGLTAWEVRARYATVPVPGGCRLADARAHVEIVTTLPEWRHKAGADLQLRLQWRDLLASLVEHEKTHHKHAMQAATTTATLLAQVPVQPDCPSVERRARSILDGAVKASRKRSLQYDRDTRFGQLEGVRLDTDIQVDLSH